MCVDFIDVCRGKLLNVRDASAAQIAANAEIQAIKQIMGLQHGKVCRFSLRHASCRSQAEGMLCHSMGQSTIDTDIVYQPA